MTRKIAIIYGLGGSWLDPPGGERYLVARCKSIGLDTGPGPFTYSDSQGVHDFLIDSDWRAIVGDSFGADFGPVYAGDLTPHKINYLAGFQPSMYATDVRSGLIGVPPNVEIAHCIRDPFWMDTGGLGYAKWYAVNPRATKLLTTEHRGAHPDDFGYAQDLVFAEIKHLIGA